MYPRASNPPNVIRPTCSNTTIMNGKQNLVKRRMGSFFLNGQHDKFNGRKFFKWLTKEY